VGDAARKLADHLHAQSSLEPLVQFGSFALANFALESVGDDVSGKTHCCEREIEPATGAKLIEPQDASIGWSLQHDAGPGKNPDGKKRLLTAAGR
jgi:hypothetical protein